MKQFFPVSQSFRSGYLAVAMRLNIPVVMIAAILSLLDNSILSVLVRRFSRSYQPRVIVAMLENMEQGVPVAVITKSAR